VEDDAMLTAERDRTLHELTRLATAEKRLGVR